MRASEGEGERLGPAIGVKLRRGLHNAVPSLIRVLAPLSQRDNNDVFGADAMVAFTVAVSRTSDAHRTGNTNCEGGSQCVHASKRRDYLVLVSKRHAAASPLQPNVCL